MMKKSSPIIGQKEVEHLTQQLGAEFVVIQNPDYIHPAFEICPLAPKITGQVDRLCAIVQDMDGTTTTTENLCLYSLEMMMRQFSGRMTKDAWRGLDRVADYPHIIGNSTTKHVEYLVRTYQRDLNYDHFREAYLRSALVTLAMGRDAGRKGEVLINLKHFHGQQLLDHPKIQNWQRAFVDNAGNFPDVEVDAIIRQTAMQMKMHNFSDQVRAAIDIYYQIYHEILFKIENEATTDLAALLADKAQHLIEPMPGVGVFLATIKGWLGEAVELFYDELRRDVHGEFTDEQIQECKNNLKRMGRYFQAHPLKVAIVTSSIFYEAHIVLTEVFKVLQRQVAQWPLTAERQQFFINKFSSYQQVFDGVITASDSSEIRLKPHRDLYSLALHQLGIDKNDFDKVIGFEDSESGTIAIRAAGIGLCVAVPFAETQGHQLDYASHILHGGLSEAMLRHYLFLSERILRNVK